MRRNASGEMHLLKPEYIISINSSFKINTTRQFCIKFEIIKLKNEEKYSPGNVIISFMYHFKLSQNGGRLFYFFLLNRNFQAQHYPYLKYDMEGCNMSDLQLNLSHQVNCNYRTLITHLQFPFLLAFNSNAWPNSARDKKSSKSEWHRTWPFSITQDLS